SFLEKKMRRQMARHRFRRKRKQQNATTTCMSILLPRDMWIIVLGFLDLELVRMYRAHNRFWRNWIDREKIHFDNDVYGWNEISHCRKFCACISRNLYIDLIHWGWRRWKHDLFSYSMNEY